MMKRALNNRKRTAGAARREGILALTALAVSLVALAAACAALLLQLRAPAAAETETETKPPSYIEYRNGVLPVLEGVPANEYAVEAFEMGEDGFLRYEDAPLGVDVSSYQGEIDWAQVAESGIAFAMVRAGLRGYTRGGLMEDAMFERNFRGATEAGLDVGVYFFSQATSVAEAEQEADYLLGLIGGRRLTYPVVFDWETVGEPEARTNGVSSETVTACARAFCDRVEAAGYEPMVYFNLDQGYLAYQLDKLDGCLFWLAEYREQPGFYYHFDFLQYTHRGRVNGIEGAVDLDLDLRKCGKKA